MRYIDYLLPSDTESSFDYIPESLQGVRPTGVSELSECYWIGHFKLASGGINLRVMPRLPAGTFMPPLFGPLDLAPAKTQIEAQKRAAKQEAFGCIDTDRILPIENMLHTAEVVRAFKMMHEDVSNLFQSTMSEKAKKVWM